MEREAPLFLEARTWKILETIFDRKSSPALRKFLVKAVKFDPKTSQNRAQDVPKSRSGGDSVGNRVSIPNRSELKNGEKPADTVKPMKFNVFSRF